MFNRHSTLDDVMISLEEIHQQQCEEIAKAEAVIKGMKSEAKETYSKLLMMDQLMGKGKYIEAYPKPKRPHHPELNPEFIVDESNPYTDPNYKWPGVGHDPSGNQY